MDIKSKGPFIAFVLVINLCCFWQIVSICQLFFSYPTNISIETDFDVFEIPLPSLTFCTNIRNRIRGKVSEDIFKTFKTQDIIGNITTIDQDHQETIVDIFSNYTVESLSMDYYCFTINSFKQGNIMNLTLNILLTSYSAGRSFRLKQNVLLKINLVQFGTYDNWWLFIHNSYDIPSAYDWNAVEIKKSFTYLLTFSLISYNLLETPYPTNCWHYSRDTEYLSRKDCIRKCKINRSLDKCGVISYETDVYRDEPMVIFAETKDKIKCVKKLSLKRNCLKICPNNDCYKQYYKSKIVSHSNHSKDISEVSLALPTDPLIAHHQKPQFETIEFLCYIGSTFSLWFGFSMFVIHDSIQRFFWQTKLAISNYQCNYHFIILKLLHQAIYDID